MNRILVVKLADLGDLLTATPALRALRLAYPHAEVTALVAPHTASLLDGNDAVSRVVTFPKVWFDRPSALATDRRALQRVSQAWALAVRLRRARFDAAVVLHHLTTAAGRAKYRLLLLATGAPVRVGLDNGAGTFLTHRAPDRGFGARHEVEYWLDVVATLGATHAKPDLELHLTTDELARGDALWVEAGMGRGEAVVLHPGSGLFSLARRWAPERFAAVGDALARDGFGVAVVAGPGEEGVAASVRRAMRTPSALLAGLGSPRELAAVVRRARLLVGNDSGVAHLAAAMGVPVVGVFGLTNHRAWGPYPPGRHRVVRLDLSCSPCCYTGHRLGTPQGCAARSCLVDLAPARVVAAARELLEQRTADRSEAKVRVVGGG